MRLWHYTCDHGHLGIESDRELRPGLDGWVWLTDLGPGSLPPARLRQALGLTSHLLDCDRMKHAYEVHATERVVPWLDVVAAGLVPRQLAETLGRGRTRPANWYVAAGMIPIRSALPDRIGGG